MTIELWEHLFVREIDKLVDPPDWLRALRERWYQWAHGKGVGINSIFLDEEVRTEEQRQTLVTLAQAALATLDQYGEFIPNAVLETFPMIEGNGGWNEETTVVKCFGIYFLKLLNGEYPLTGSDWGRPVEWLRDEKEYERWSLLVQQKNKSS